MQTMLAERTDILCFSHLRWDWVYQRPQHLLSRLARDHGHRVFFVEEPLGTTDPATGHSDEAAAPVWDLSEVAPNVIRCVPRFQATWPFFVADHDADTITMRALLRELVVTWEIVQPIVWFYAPLALPLLDELDASAVVYDCMDELSLFAGAPPVMLAREDALLEVAEVVFTGGHSIYEARLGRHPNLHLFPSSVDQQHFGQALRPWTAVPDDARPGTPALGYYGVLDERLDLPLLDGIATLRPDWHFVMLGPVTKIAPESLPRHTNLYYPGMRPYEALPGYLKGWDVCLMPFARNDATRFISPTKTLEYLAAEKPVVSTSIRDVVADYQGVVHFADEPAAFVAAIEAALNETREERARRLAAGRALLAETSWDRTAAQMSALIETASAGTTLVSVEQSAD